MPGFFLRLYSLCDLRCKRNLTEARKFVWMHKRAEVKLLGLWNIGLVGIWAQKPAPPEKFGTKIRRSVISQPVYFLVIVMKSCRDQVNARTPEDKD